MQTFDILLIWLRVIHTPRGLFFLPMHILLEKTVVSDLRPLPVCRWWSVRLGSWLSGSVLGSAMESWTQTTWASWDSRWTTVRMVLWTGESHVSPVNPHRDTNIVAVRTPARNRWKTFLLPLRFDPDFICNASDNSGRYSYKAQPAICRWNLVKLAEALDPELPPDRAEAVMDEYLDLYNSFYLDNMRKKLGLLTKNEPEDEMLITELLQTMHNTGGTGWDSLLPRLMRGESAPHTECCS